MKELVNIIFTGSFTYPYGYAGTKRIQHLINCIKSQNHQASVLLIRNLNKEKKRIFGNTKYYTLAPNLPKILVIIIAPFIYISSFILLLKMKKLKCKNILYVYSGINIENFFIVVYAKIIGFKIITDIVEDFQLSEENVSRWRRLKIKSNILLDRIAINLSDGYIVISKKLYNKYHNKVKKILFLPVMAEENKYKKIKNSEVTKILYSGTYGKKEGLEFLFKALKKILSEHNFVEIILTGRITKNTEELLRTFSLRVNITGYLEDKKYYEALKNADILVMPRNNSEYANAGFPFKLGEYLATGNAVLTTKVSDIDLYLKDKDNAVLVEAENAEGIYLGLKYLIDNPLEADEIGLKGMKVWRQYFSLEPNGSKFMSFVKTL